MLSVLYLFINHGEGEAGGVFWDVWSGFHSYTPVSRPPYPRSLLSVNDPRITLDLLPTLTIHFTLVLLLYLVQTVRTIKDCGTI